MSNLFYIVVIAVTIPLAAVIGYLVRKNIGAHQVDSAEAKAANIISEAKNKQKETLLQTKDKALKFIDDAKNEARERRKEISHLQQRLEKRETLFDKKILDLENKQQRLIDKAQKIDSVKKEINNIKTQQLEKLEKIASLSIDDAKKILLNQTEKLMKDDLLIRIKKLENEASEELDRKAKIALAGAIQRCATSHVPEITTTTVDLPSDEMKGRIIGREGRNIKTIEQLTGVEIVVDDTPQLITISGFSPIRRHVAKKALEKLILDGRIHPTKIEDAIESAKKELSVEIKKAGEDAAYEVGVAGLDPKLIHILGRLKYRTSYGQNVLRHSVEVAHLSSLLASELNADVAIAKKGGLLHDIGKAVDHEVQGTHPEIGRDIAKKFNLPDEIIAPILTHHEDRPPTLEAVIVKVADAISGARPGARKDSYERYLQRLTELEELANSFEGVEKTYAIQAGREIRVFVTPDKINDMESFKLAREIANRIENDLKYPGEIKVNVIREMRITEYAR